MPAATIPTPASHTIDNTDWLKSVAIILVAIDHFGFFFIENADWWSVFGRLAAPVFFFLIGYAQSRTVPARWIVLGVFLTVLESWNADWSWVAPNILLSFALVRYLRPYVQGLLEKYNWITFVSLVFVLLAMLPEAAQIADYGASGWLWALFGLCQRMYVDRASNMAGQEPAQTHKLVLHKFTKPGLLRLIACLTAASIYMWQEQLEFEFSAIHLASCIFGISVLCVILVRFRRGPSRIQPPRPIAQALHFTGRHTLEIYAIQLAGSELIVKFAPDLAV